MPAPSEAPTTTRQNPEEAHFYGQCASELFQQVAKAFGIDPERKGGARVQRTIEDEFGELVESLELTQTISGLSQVKIEIPGQSITITPKQEKMMMILEGFIEVKLPNGKKLTHPEAYAQAKKAVSATLQHTTSQA